MDKFVVKAPAVFSTEKTHSHEQQKIELEIILKPSMWMIG